MKKPLTKRENIHRYYLHRRLRRIRVTYNPRKRFIFLNERSITRTIGNKHVIDLVRFYDYTIKFDKQLELDLK